MASFFDQLPSARGGGFSSYGHDPSEATLDNARMNAIFQASRAVQQGDTQLARDILMPFGLPGAAEATAPKRQPIIRSIPGGGAFSIDPVTMETSTIREPIQKDIKERSQRIPIAFDVFGKPSAYAEMTPSELAAQINDLPKEVRNSEAVQTILRMAPSGTSGASAPAAPPFRNRSFIGGQTALSPEEVQQMQAAEQGYFGSGRIQGLDRVIPPIEAPAASAPQGSFFDAVRPPDAAPSFDQSFGSPFGNLPMASTPQPTTPQSGFNIQTNRATGLPEFGTEAQARAAGIQPGQPFMVFDPATQRFRPARLRN